MMTGAERQFEQLDFPDDLLPAAGSSDPRAVLKQQVSERLAAHRQRRGHPKGTNLVPIAEPKPLKARANRIAAAVAERYAQTPSYRDFLAAEAARAVDVANAAAEVAARNAEAVTVAQQRLLAELDQWDLDQSNEPAAFKEADPAPAPSAYAVTQNSPAVEANASIAGLTVRLYEDVGEYVVARPPRVSSAVGPRQTDQDAALEQELYEEESFLLDEEIAFRQTPVFTEPAGPPVSIPANLIEFPRQLVAPRKARPRIAEGPLRDDGYPTATQLRIFEVEPEQIATAPSVDVEVAAPEWSSIHLDAVPVTCSVADSQAYAEVRDEVQALLPLQTASLNLRAMAAAVDGCILGATFLAAAAAFAWRATELPAPPMALLGAAATLLVLFVVYHLLFFTLSNATPGMRYARIGLCTFSDENPTRAQMRRRTWAVLLAACPLGIGFLWALLDDDRLGWHDRISRMYQRGY